MAYSGEEEEGFACSFSIYLAEGDALAKQGDFVKAIQAYTIALEIQPDDKNCLVARSKCHLKLGDAEAALKDAEASIKESKSFVKGLFQKAEALYAMGDFEFSLVHYHRGNKLRPELDEFRLGIQKAREAIDNSIGNPNTVKLTSKGDLSYFYKYQDEKAGKKGKPTARKKPAPAKPTYGGNKAAETQNTKSLAGDKTVKQLLGELYEDREYLEKLLVDSRATKQTDSTIKSLVSNGINYLDSRLEFWRQQQPLYSRKKKRIDLGNRNRLIKGVGPDPTQYVLKNLDDIDGALADGKPGDSLQLARACLKKVRGLENLPNKKEFIANLHSCVGCALLEMGNLDGALKEHKQDLDISSSIKSEEGKARALDNMGRTYARRSEYSEAVKYWEQRIPMEKSVLEAAWLYHELGRCCLELGQFSEASTYGEQSLEAAVSAEDDNWQINSSVLIAQAEVKLSNDEKALENFNRALEIAKVLDDKAVQDAITKAISDVNYRIAEDIRKQAEDPKPLSPPKEASPAPVSPVKEATPAAVSRQPTPPAEAKRTPTPKAATPAKSATPAPAEATPKPATPVKSATPKPLSPAAKSPTPAPTSPKPATPVKSATPKPPTPKSVTPAPAEATPKPATPAAKSPTPAPAEATPAPATPAAATPAAPTPAKSATPAPAEATPKPATPLKSATPKPATPVASAEPTPAPKSATPAPTEATPAPATPAAATPAAPTPAAKSPTPAPAEATPAPATPAAATPAAPTPAAPTPAAATPAAVATPAPAEATPAPATPAAATPAAPTPAAATPAAVTPAS